MEPEITDIFDRIMNWKLLRFMWPFYKKNKDKLLYLFFGGCTTLVNLVITYGLWYGLKWEQWYAGKFALGTFLGNLIGIVSAILFAYVTNKKFVFASKTTGMKELLVEFIKFPKNFPASARWRRFSAGRRQAYLAVFSLL